MKFSAPTLKSLTQIGLVLASACLASAQEKSGFYLKDGDRVVFYGDSITDQRLYTTFAETYVVTRFPQMNIFFVHSGWGGDRVGGGGGGPIDVRLKRDVYAYHPTVMTIMLGMNDGSYRAFDQKIFDQYSGGFQKIVDDLKKNLPGLRLTLIQPSPFDDVTQPPKFEGGYNKVLVRYGEFLKELAEREKLDLADLNTPVVAALQKAKETKLDVAQKIIPDRVHPGASGHLLMAAALLKAWRAPAVVTTVEIDATGKSVSRSDKTEVSGLEVGDALKWQQLDAALPMPVDMNDAVTALAVNSSDFIDSLDRQILKVSGLSAPNYSLKIDGMEAGSFTKEQLGAGINLALLPTPMAKQAMEVHKLTLQHNNLHFTRWRQFQVPFANQKSERVQTAMQGLLEAFDADEADVVKQQRAAAQPLARKYELIPQ